MAGTPMHRRTFLGTAAGLTAGALLSGGIGRSARAADMTRLTYLTPFGYLIGFSETMYADTGGFFAKHGLDVKIEGGRGSAMAVQQVTAGNVLLSRTGGTDLIKAYAKDPSVVAIGEIYPKNLFYVISSQEKPIKSAADLAGKTLGIVSTGGATENILDMMLAAVDVPAGDVQRQVVGNAPSAFEFIRQGRIDGYIATSDTVLQLRIDGKDPVAWSTDEVAPAPGQVYMTSRSQLADKTETLGAFLAAVYDSLGALRAAKDLTPILQSMEAKYEVFEAKRPDKGKAVLENAIQSFEPAYQDKLAMEPETWTKAYELMVKAKIIEPLEDPRFWDDAARKVAFG